MYVSASVCIIDVWNFPLFYVYMFMRMNMCSSLSLSYSNVRTYVCMHPGVVLLHSREDSAH
jgi:hypothetical protein